MKPVLWRSRKQCYFALGFNLVSLLPLLIPLVCFQTALYHTSVQMPSVVSCIWPYLIYVLFLLCFHLFPFSSTLPCMLATLLSNRFPSGPLHLFPLTGNLFLQMQAYFLPPFPPGFWLIDISVKGSLTSLLKIAAPSPCTPLLWPCFFIFFLQCLSPSADSCVLLGRKLMFVHGRIFKSWPVLGI